MTCEHTRPAPSDCKQSEKWRGEEQEEVKDLKVERGVMWLKAAIAKGT